MEHRLNSEKGQSSKSSSDLDEGGALPQRLLEFHFLTLFPELFAPVLNSSLLGKAQDKGIVSYHLTQIREFSQDRHSSVDGAPYGGGEGMILKADVLYSAWKSIQPSQALPAGKSATLLVSPQGELFNQDMAKELSGYSQLILVCGHYEGVDERFIDLCVDREVSIGDYVLTGGELPALVIADGVTRLLPGVVGKQRSLTEDSLENGLLKYPQYTRPRVFQDLNVPDVLLSGDHAKIAQWRENQRRERTQRKRPDLFNKLLNPP